MSASREKKQRHTGGFDRQGSQTEKEQAAHKRKVYGYTAIGVVVVILVAALLIWNSRIFQRRAVAATIGGETITVAELSYYYQNARMIYTYGTLDTTLSDAEQLYNEEEGVTYRDFFLETALEEAQSQMVLYKAALEAGYSLDDVQDQLKENISSMRLAAARQRMSYASYIRAVYGPYMTVSLFEKIAAKGLLINQYSSDRSEELSDSYTQDDLDAYYKEHSETLDTFEYSHLYFPIETVDTTDEDGNPLDEDAVTQAKEEAKAAAHTAAEKAQKAFNDGSTVAELISEYTPSNSSDHTSAVGSSGISSSFQEELLKLEKGQSALVDDDNGTYLIILHERTLTEEPTANVRHILVKAETTQDEDGNPIAPTDEAWAAAKEKAESIQAEYEAGEQTEDAFAALANQYSDDGGSNTSGGLYENAHGLVSEFEEWMFDSSRTSGDVGLVQHVAGENDTNKYWGYHLIYYVSNGEFTWQVNARSTLTKEAMDSWADDLTEGIESTLSDGAKYLGN